MKPGRMTLPDRVISYFSPAWGFDRATARARLDAATSTGGYDGGRRDRRATKRWRPLDASADADTLLDLSDLRGRSRDLVRNVPIATGAIATTVTNVVGDGLVLQASLNAEALGMDETAADAWEQAAEAEWCHFCATADFTRVQCFEEIQSLVLRGVLESGDIVVVRRYRKDAGDVYGTKLQVLEADRLCNPNRAADSDTIAGGVEVDADGVHAAYHITNKHPGGLRFSGLKWERVSARTSTGLQVVLHLYDRLRPELTRGVPYLAPVVEFFKQLGTYSDAEIHAAVTSAMYTVFLQTPNDTGEPIVGEADSTLDDNEIKLGNGAVVSLAEGEEAVFANPTRPNANFDPFVQAILRQIGVALEIPFEMLIKHFTASYSASRAALEMAWQFFRKRRCWLSRRFCQVVYEWVIDEAVASGRLQAPGYFADPLVRQAYCGAVWHGPARASLDPQKEAAADQIDLQMGVKTREQICLERTGGQFEDKHRQLEKEETMRRDAGLGAPPPAAGKGNQADQPAGENDQNDNGDGAGDYESQQGARA